MARSRPAQLSSRPVVLGATAAFVLAGSVVLIAGRHALGVLEPPGTAAAIPGMTVGDDDVAETAMPVVTSLRSNGEAERRGLRVGDHIEAVDGNHVRNVAQLQRALDTVGAETSVALHVRRGDALWTVAIDRIEPITRERHDAQDIAGRG